MCSVCAHQTRRVRTHLSFSASSMCLNAYKLFWMFKWARRIFRMPQSQLKWKSCAIALVINRNSMKKSVLQSQHRRREFMNERVKSLSQRCCDLSSRFFKWVYGNPLPLLVGICHIPAYHVDYTTAFIQKGCIKLIKSDNKNIYNATKDLYFR